MADTLVGVSCVLLVEAGGCIAECDTKLTAGDISMDDLVGGVHWTVWSCSSCRVMTVVHPAWKLSHRISSFLNILCTTGDTA